MQRFLLEIFGLAIGIAGGFVWGYRKCKRDYKIKK